MYKRRYLEKCNSGFLKNNLIIKCRGHWNINVFVINTKKKLVKIPGLCQNITDHTFCTTRGDQNTHYKN